MEIADSLLFTQRDQTLRPTADAHHAIAGVGAGRDPSSTGLCPAAPKGRVFAHRVGAELRANRPPDSCLGRVVLRAKRHRVLADKRPHGSPYPGVRSAYNAPNARRKDDGRSSSSSVLWYD